MTRPAVPASLLEHHPDDPPWLTLFLQALAIDTNEVPGAGFNPFIGGLFREMGLDPAKRQDDVTKWCAIGCCAILKRSGYKPWPAFSAARGALSWGMPIMVPSRGDIMVLDRVDPKEPLVKHGHVNVYLGTLDHWYAGVGCNQHNRISADVYELGRVVGIRRPLVKL